MNKTDLVEAVAAAADISKAAAGRSVDTILEVIAESLRDGDAVTLSGFGTFSVRRRPARHGRNPRTGASIEIKEAMMPVFKPGKALKEAVN